MPLPIMNNTNVHPISYRFSDIEEDGSNFRGRHMGPLLTELFTVTHQLVIKNEFKNSENREFSPVGKVSNQYVVRSIL